MKRRYYQSVRACDNSDDEWIVYEGYSRYSALLRTKTENRNSRDKHFTTETRAYDLPDDRDFEKLSEEEQNAVLCSYDIIDDEIIAPEDVYEEDEGWF